MALLMNKENSKNILIRNIYYMLTYAFFALRQTNYARIEAEEFENIEDLFASIIQIGTAEQLKHGFYRRYITRSEQLKVLRGKLDLTETVRLRVRNNRQDLGCEHDELSVDNIYNQILKTTIVSLIRCKKVKKETRIKLQNILRLLGDISEITLARVKWGELTFQKNNRTYEVLINMCYFVYQEMILSNTAGDKKVQSFSDENMAKVYEKFILEYYRQNYKSLRVKASEIKWNLDEDFENPVIFALPKMQSDITLRANDKTLIIDAKYYSKVMQQQFEKTSLRNSHLYQIYTYVKNEDKENTGNVAGMLLYAKTRDEVIPRTDFSTGGNRISARSLDLDVKFDKIKEQLDSIIKEYF